MTPTILLPLAFLVQTDVDPLPRLPRFVETGLFLPQAGTNVQDVVAGDFDGDGDGDLVFANFDQADLYFERVRPAGFVAAPARLPVDGVRTKALASGDLDADGDLDLVLGTSIHQVASHAFLGGFELVLLNDGTGAFPTGRGGWSFQDQTEDLALGDIDGDGDLDLVVANGVSSPGPAGSELNRLYLNDGVGNFLITVGALPFDTDDTTGVALGDLDQDGDRDAVFVNRGFPGTGLQGFTRVLLNTGGTLAPAVDLGLATDTMSDVVLADIDGNGALDILAASAGQQNRAFLNQGAAAFVEATATVLPLVDDGTLAFASADFDRDGDPDLVAGNVFGQPDVLYRNTGGVLVAVPNALGGTSGTTAIALADLDGDLDTDLVFASVDGFEQVLLNDGAGGFRDVTSPQDAAVRFDASVATGDWSGDGLKDAIVFGDATRLLANDGTGVLFEAARLTPAGGGFGAGGLADVDGDADLDVFVATGSGNRLFTNDGAGGFTDASAVFPPALSLVPAVCLGTGDIDGDGTLDVYYGTNEGLKDVLALQGTTGLFTDESARLPNDAVFTNHVELADFDGDGLTDVFLSAGHFFTQRNDDRLYLQAATGTFLDATTANLPAATTVSMGLDVGDVDRDGDLDAWISSGVPNGGFGAFAGPDRLLLNDGSGAFLDGSANHPNGIGLGRVTLVDLDRDGDLDSHVGAFYDFDEGRTLANLGDGTFVATGGGILSRPEPRAVAFADLDGDRDLDALGVGRGTNRVFQNATLELARANLPELGATLRMELWGPPHARGLLAFSLATASIPTPNGRLRIDPTSATFLPPITLDTFGRGALEVPVPDLAVLAGLRVHWQARIAGRLTGREDTVLTDY